jgi:hypothetical protein
MEGKPFRIAGGQNHMHTPEAACQAADHGMAAA